MPAPGCYPPTMRKQWLVALALLLLAPIGAGAQQDRGTVFLGAGALAAVERFSSLSPDLTGIGGGSDGTVAGGTAGLAVHLGQHWSARVEWSLTSTLTSTRRDTQTIPTYPFLSTTFPPGLGELVYVPTTSTQTTRRESQAGFTLVGYHLGEGRTTMELLAGLGVVAERAETEYMREPSPLFPNGPQFPLPSFTTGTTTYYAVPVVGVDVRAGVTRSLSLVPGVRVWATDDRVSIRPTVAVRWTF